MNETVTVEMRDDVAIVRIDNPKVNALSRHVLRELRDVFIAMAAKTPGAIVVTGTDRIFSAGADVSELANSDARREVTGGFAEAFAALSAVPCLSVAAINGFAIGGGCELALACDFRLATASARLGQPEILLGLIPGAGGTQRLVRTVGPGRARELVMTGRQVLAEEALRIGLVDRVVGSEELMATALDLAGTLAGGPRLAQLAARKAIAAAIERPLSMGLAFERDLFESLLATRDAEIGIKTFLQRDGTAKFTGS